MSRVSDEQIAEWREKWLPICRGCDGGIGPCTHPMEDYRLTMSRILDTLVAERDRADCSEEQAKKAEHDLEVMTTFAKMRDEHCIRAWTRVDEACRSWRSEKARADRAEARLAAVRAFAEEMRGYCSPNGVSVMYAHRLIAVLEEQEATE